MEKLVEANSRNYKTENNFELFQRRKFKFSISHVTRISSFFLFFLHIFSFFFYNNLFSIKSFTFLNFNSFNFTVKFGYFVLFLRFPYFSYLDTFMLLKEK